jgi:hypothetical protein
VMRRQVLLLFAASLTSLPYHTVAQTPRTPKVGVLITHAAVDDPVFESLREGLRELGYQDGRNISLRFVTAGGQLDRLPALAKDNFRARWTPPPCATVAIAAPSRTTSSACRSGQLGCTSTDKALVVNLRLTAR